MVCKVWPLGSLEDQVQNLVKNWEMEFFNKADLNEHKSVDLNKFTFSVNGRTPLTLEEAGKLGGGYNPLLQTSLPEKYRSYNPDTETAETSTRLSLQHSLVEFYGMAIFELDEHDKVVKVEFFYDHAELLGGLLKGPVIDASAEGAVASSCPVLRSTG
ncbi:pathogen-related protein-like [Quillaja saponaria]|uniref:Pathogen-related protein-like n=1 Tax=Quillaja saponaria TaxID=32244 RepID=A0AAD7LW34_QUISA|nr:pathogen-related protein-like [Quillaja saponaria]